MAEKGTQNSTTGAETDISKAQSAQQPPAQARQEQAGTGEERGQFETELTGDQAATGQPQTGAAPDEALQGETATRQRTDIEGGTLASPETGEAESGFVGAEGQQDTSAELIEDEEEDFAPDGQGAPEGK